MHSRELKATLKAIIQADIKTTVYIAGPPGVAKSSVVTQVASEEGYGCVDLRVGQLTPSEIRGLPMVTNGVSTYARPEWLPTEGKHVLFLDEFANGSPTLMQLCQQLILDRRIGEHQLGPDVFIIAAGNRKVDQCVVNPLPASVANRMIHIEVEPDLDTWVADFAVPQQLAPEIVAFLRFRPSLLHKYVKGVDAWASPRSWATASDLFKANLNVGFAVGPDVASEFYAFIKVFRSLPDIDAVLSGGGGVALSSTAPDLMFAVVSSLSTRWRCSTEFINAFTWLAQASAPEWVSLFWSDSEPRVQQTRGLLTAVAKLAKRGNLSGVAGVVARISELESLL